MYMSQRDIRARLWLMTPRERQILIARRTARRVDEAQRNKLLTLLATTLMSIYLYYAAAIPMIKASPASGTPSPNVVTLFKTLAKLL